MPYVAPVLPKPRCGAKSGMCPARNAAFDTRNGKRCVESGISSAKSVKGDLAPFGKPVVRPFANGGIPECANGGTAVCNVPDVKVPKGTSPILTKSRAP